MLHKYLFVNLLPEPDFLNFQGAKNQFQGTIFASLRSLAGRYYNPIITRFLASIYCFKIPAQDDIIPDICEVCS